MKKSIILYFALLFSTLSISAQKIKIISGNPKLFEKVKSYHLTFDYSDLKVEKYEDEQSYIEFMMDDAEKRKEGGGENWFNIWNDKRVDSYQPKFIELFNKYSGNKINIDTVFKDQQYELNVRTQFLEIGNHINGKKSKTYIDVIVTLYNSDSSEVPLIISMSNVNGKDFAVFTLDNSLYSADFRRIEEAYARCGRELAKYMIFKIY